MYVYFVDVSGGQAQNRQSDDFDMFAQSRQSFDQNRENMRCVSFLLFVPWPIVFSIQD